jgi:hypothetical protein
MSQNLTPQLHDEIYQALQRLAQGTGMTIDALATEWVARYGSKSRPQLPVEAQKAALERLLQRMGVENLGSPTGADNESIGADLAKEYASVHKGKS